MGLADEVRREQARQRAEEQLRRDWERLGVSSGSPQPEQLPNDWQSVVREALPMIRFRGQQKCFLGRGPDGVLRIAKSHRNPNTQYVDIPVGGQGKEEPGLKLVVLQGGLVYRQGYKSNWDKVTLTEFRAAIVEFLAKQ